MAMVKTDLIQSPYDRAILLIVTGPAGSGKTTLRERMVETYTPQLQRVVTATTRPMRPGEVDGVDYHFLSDEVFTQRVAENAFYEHAVVHGKHSYGALKGEIQDKLQSGTDMILNVDVQGVVRYREAAQTDPILRGRLVTVFILPQNLEQIESRLRIRERGNEAEIARRLETAKREIEQWRSFDYAFHSNTRDDDFAAVRAIYHAEKLRNPNPQ